MMKIIIVIPTYNEAKNIKDLVGRILDLKINGLTIVFVDDNSPDGTGKIADRLATKHKGKVKVIHRKGKLGLGTAYKEGFNFAFKEKPDAIVTMDADLSHDPKDIPTMLGFLEEYDLVIGSRYVEGGGIVGFSIWRLLISSIAQAFCRNILAIKQQDSTTAFRAYRTKPLKNIKPETIESDGYSFLIEIIYRFQKKNFKTKEVPTIFKAREKGESKISEKEIYKAFVTILKLRTSS